MQTVACQAKAPVVAKPAPAQPHPSLVVPRRAVLSAVFLAGLTAADKAKAITIPSQQSTPGNKSGSSFASAAAYAMEGIKKRGISASERKKLMAAVPRAVDKVLREK